MHRERLEELRGRVEGAVGPDRRIDAAVCRTFDLPECLEPDCLPDVFSRCIRRVEMGGEDSDVPAYTASLDAALALVKRCLPGWRVHVSALAGPATADLCLANVYPERAPVEGATPALAVIAALLRALSAEQDSSSRSLPSPTRSARSPDTLNSGD